jgi:hypothetical protein
MFNTTFLPLLTLALVILVSACQKAPLPNTMKGEASGMLNGRIESLRVEAEYSATQKHSVSLLSSDAFDMPVRITFSNIPDSIARMPVSNLYRINTPYPKATLLVGTPDRKIAIYGLMECPDSELTVTGINPRMRIIQGACKGVFVREHQYVPGYASLPDTIYLTQGQFRAQYNIF